VDRRSLWRIARRDNYETDNPVLLIVEDAPPDQHVRVYRFAVKPRKRWGELAVVAAAAGRYKTRPSASGPEGSASSSRHAPSY
jgi:hypothetical protein